MAKCASCRGKGYTTISEAARCPAMHSSNIPCLTCFGQGYVTVYRKKSCTHCHGMGMMPDKVFPDSSNNDNQPSGRYVAPSKSNYGFGFWFGIIFFLFIGIALFKDKSGPETGNSNRNNQTIINAEKTSNKSTSSLKNHTGRLTTNLNLRSAPNKTASSVGIHFQNAQIKILDEKSFKAEDGYSTWYKVRVVEYGCDAQGDLGCGKNSDSDADEGWLNARYVAIESEPSQTATPLPTLYESQYERKNNQNSLQVNEKSKPDLAKEITVMICPLTGMRATTDCPNKQPQTFANGEQPNQFCTFHVTK